MKPFQFPLQPLRALREHKEAAARERYAGALRACEEAAAQVQVASTELTGCWTTLCEKLAAGVKGNDLLRARAWCNVLELRVKERAAALEKARQNVDAVWQDLMLATRERETIERFYDKRRLAYDLELQREEQKNLDELSIQFMRSPIASHLASRAQ
jgi:flagellar export protein FliJ